MAATRPRGVPPRWQHEGQPARWGEAVSASYGRTVGGMGRCEKCDGLSYFFNLNGRLVCSECNLPAWKKQLRAIRDKLRGVSGG